MPHNISFLLISTFTLDSRNLFFHSWPNLIHFLLTFRLTKYLQRLTTIVKSTVRCSKHFPLSASTVDKRRDCYVDQKIQQLSSQPNMNLNRLFADLKINLGDLLFT